ncbi:MAG: response regulator, partial [Desulfobacterales bacterium]
MNEKSKILIIEDDADLVAAITKILEIKGYIAKSAYDPEEGWAKLKHEKPDLIILDVMFGSKGESKGFGFAQQIRSDENFSDIPILMLTAINTEKPPCPVTLMNAHVCLQAPFGRRELRRARFWSRALRRVARTWQWLFGLYCGTTVFYLWDLLPAIYLSYPELFDENPAAISSTVADLETGALVLSANGDGARVNLP